MAPRKIPKNWNLESSNREKKTIKSDCVGKNKEDI